MIMTRTFLAQLLDRPGVLNRVTSLFRRRGFNIESLTVGRTARPGVSHMTLVMNADDHTARRLEANLHKLVDVLEVEEISGTAAVARELALIKVRADAETRPRVLQLADVFRARIVDVAADALIVEITGAPDKIDGLADVLRPFGIVELVRTGVVAMTRGVETSAAAVAAA